MSFQLNERVRYKPTRGAAREGKVMPGFVDHGEVKVQLDGDPFPVNLKASQVSSCKVERKVLKSTKKAPKVGAQPNKETQTMTTATKPSAKELRTKARSLGIKGWEDMGRKEMARAIRKAEKGSTESAPVEKPAKSKPKASSTKPAAKAKAAEKAEKPATKAKAKATKAPAKKAAATTKAKALAKAKDAPVKGSDEALGLTFASSTPPKDLPAEGENPFRKSSNLFLVAKLLLQGGTRSVLAKKLSEKVDLHPYHKGADEVNLGDFDKRLLLGAQTMRDQYGYGIQRTGRGIEGKILVFRPDGPKDPRTKSKGKK